MLSVVIEETLYVRVRSHRNREGELFCANHFLTSTLIRMYCVVMCHAAQRSSAIVSVPGGGSGSSTMGECFRSYLQVDRTIMKRSVSTRAERTLCA